MRLGTTALFATSCVAYCALLGGCRAPAPSGAAVSQVAAVKAEAVDDCALLPVTLPRVTEIIVAPPGPADEVEAQPVAYLETAEEVPLATPDAQSNVAVLDLNALVAEVLAVNPDIRAASAAWRAAAQRYPQEVSLEDPMFGYMLGPGSWGSDEVMSAYTLEASQKIPWPGKREMRGNVARAEANAAYYDVGEERLRIAEVTRLAYFEYCIAHHHMDVVAESTKFLKDSREIALKRYESASAEQQDVLLADVELGQLQRRLLELTRREQVARARINTLLLYSPDAPLAPPPQDLPSDQKLPEAEFLRNLAISQRPELAAQAARIRAEEYSLSLAYKEFYPDFEVVSRYDAFWQEEPLRPMVGMNLNVPLYRNKRWAAVCEARALLAKRRAEFDSQVNEISYDVEQAYRQVEESANTVEIYKKTILPSSKHSVEAARASYVAGRLDFLRLIEAQRQLLDAEERYFEELATYHQRLAELERLVGFSPNGPHPIPEAIDEAINF